ncbi:MAG: 5-methyltetrahydropteroyltriglutamate--homocysteine S-methyltransferase, partial [Actinomycetota bacterium]
MTNRGNPLFRADHVGSLLRPPAVVAARADRLGPGQLTSPDLVEVEDAAIAEVVAMQEDLGLGLVTDGEFRRSFWHYDFMDGLIGLDVVERPGELGPRELE